MGVFHVFKIVQMVPNPAKHHIYLKMNTTVATLLNEHFLRMSSFFLNTAFLCKL